MTVLKPALMILVLTFAFGCKKKDEKKAAEPGTATDTATGTEPAPATDTPPAATDTPPAATDTPPAAADTPPAAAGSPDDTVCCELDGKAAAATRGQCEGAKGKVLDKQPPC
jgi:hypothetical protein